MVVTAMLMGTLALAFDWSDLGFVNQGMEKKMNQRVPFVELTEKEEKQLYQGKCVARLLESKDALKIGYLRFFAPYDPVTVWMVITDDEHFDLEDPDYPKSGSVWDKKRTFMPYTFDCAICTEKSEKRMYQLLIMPFVAARRLCISRYHDPSEFPWEASWQLADDKLCCHSEMNPAMEKYYDEAVFLLKNVGAWNISPIPEKFIRKEEDRFKTDCIYYVDTNPGGDLAKLSSIVNRANSIALPKLMDNVIYHCQRWTEHLKKYHDPELMKKYNQWVAAYKKQYGQEKQQTREGGSPDPP